MGTIASNYQLSTPSVLNNNVNGIIDSLRVLMNLSPVVESISVPLRVLTLVDAGKNPQLYLGTFLQNSLRVNQNLKSKVKAFKFFRESLVNDLSEVFPEELAIFERLESPPFSMEGDVAFSD